ncbi:cutinase-domain-containing protein [Cercophora samala]|uniref:Cutinase-domain-containing protein n=1 Tax=Cercophora samala TaxID=330535 RepID=A0AA40D147_9PEZI|nr:cutinase-domain-containing protein [Cercophora samala]
MKDLLARALALATALFQRQVLVWDGTCSTGIHMIVARGSTEPVGYGRIGVVAQNASLLIPNSSIATIDYPATFEDYFTSYATGTSEFEKLVLEHVQACPDTKIALLGYSQGAHAMMDAVCGSSDDGFSVSPDFKKALGSQVVAIVGFGDPSFNATDPWSVGTSTGAGLFARKNITACEPYAARIRSWCDEGDVYCDLGSDRAVHGSYFANYTLDAAEFIAERFNSSDTVSDAPTTTAPPTTTPTESGTATTDGTTTETTADTTTTSPPPASGAGAFSPSWIMMLSMAGSMLVWTELL